MADDLVLSKSVERNSVVAAIEALQGRGADVNPYSLAEELDVPVSLIVGSGEVMELVSLARSEVNGVVAAEYDRLLLRVKELEESNGKLHDSGGISDLQDECRLLQARVDEEAARSRRMEEETRVLRNRNDALSNELNSLKAAKLATIEISRPNQDDLNGLFVPGLPSAEEVGELKAELGALRSKCESLEFELAAKVAGGGEPQLDNSELERLTRENAELTAFKNQALSEEEQQALSDHLATMTAKQSELNMLIDHLQRENARLTSGSESVLTAEELSVLREHIDNLSAHNAQLNEQIQHLTNERAELAARQLELVEQLTDLQEQYKNAPAQGVDPEVVAKMETERAKLKDTVAALESANQLLATSLQETYQQGYQAAKLEFAREHFAQMAAQEAAHQAELRASGVTSAEQTEDDYQGVPDYMSAGLFDESPEAYGEATHEATNEYAPATDTADGHWGNTGGAEHVYAQTAGHHIGNGQYSPDGVHQEETVDKLEMLEEQARLAAAAAQEQLQQQIQQQLQQQQQSYGGIPQAEEGPYIPEGVFGDSSAVQGFAGGYSPFAKVDVEAYGFADVLADDDKSTTAYSADELRDLVQHHLEPGAAEGAGHKTQQGLKKFVGGSRNTQEVALPSMPRNVPPDIRKACLLLGLKPEELNRQNVFNAWKREMAKPGVHPDTGGDTEMATYLNTAKDRLVRFLEETAPKLGKKFGTKENPTKEHNKQPKK